ncbi:DUF485 domain-containing protein [Ancylobacter dichloromethanicus]|uniref:DUF485 domain-containing protein n=1 Tax=Ancylobacter dichloromethanicus TaxID=518825 RepID=A0A9W6N074_9HYPH|nr:DUF485 domain-containing protein [Ancylobacter dichloromethanicus]MBS7553692.1 DUF485 domain-containing protein [Ancylobacter dichloromethanicus]GLK72760.1 hypothetical protein GCM10017643_28760 [Ancylobacter dichloromethanicus]
MTILSAPARAPAAGASPPPTPRMPDWHARVEAPTFRRLIEAKRRTIGWLLGLSLGFFFLTLLLAGYARPFMSAKAFGALNIGYVLIIGIYLVTWAAALLYMLAAHRSFDPLAAAARDTAMREGTR